MSAIRALTRRTSSANGTGSRKTRPLARHLALMTCDPQLIRRQLTLLRIDRLHAQRSRGAHTITLAKLTFIVGFIEIVLHTPSGPA